MQNFVNGIIDGEEFSEDFSGLSRQLETTCNEFKSDLEKLKDFQPDIRSKGFGSLISFFRAECDNFDEDYENDEVYDSIKEVYFQLQKTLDEELESEITSKRKKNLNYKVLLEKMFEMHLLKRE